MYYKNKISRRKFISGTLIGISSFALFPGSLLSLTNNFFNNKRKGTSRKMSYEWKFNKRPYSDDEAKALLKNVMSPETTDWHYNTHHKGYVT